MATDIKARPLFEPAIIRQAIVDSFRKLTPARQVRNPVMFVVYVGLHPDHAPLGPGAGRQGRGARGLHPRRLGLALVHRALRQLRRGDGRGPRQGAGRLAAQGPARHPGQEARGGRSATPASACVSATTLRKGDVVLVEAGDFIPADGDDHRRASRRSTRAPSPARARPSSARPAATAARSPAARRCCRTGSSSRSPPIPGEAFLDRMIALVEGAKRQKTPNEIALDILLAALTIVFLLATATLLPYSLYSVEAAGQGTPITVTVLVALLVCLIPTTIGALLSAIGIAGMDRMIQKNVIAMSGRAVEAAGDVDVLLLDKTGTITLGNRQATAFLPATGVTEAQLADAAQLASLSDETPEGRSHRRPRQGEVPDPRARDREARRDVRAVHRADADERRQPERPPDPQGRRRRRRGARRPAGRHRSRADVRASVDRIAQEGATPLVVVGRREGPRRHPAQGHREGRHQGALRGAPAHGHQDRHDHRRQPAHRRGHQRRGRASTTSSPRRRRRRS